MHRWLAVVAVLLLTFPALAEAQGRGGPPPQRRVAGHGLEVPGWWARLDNPTQRDGLKVVPSGEGIHAVTGPTTILFDPQHDWEGEYTVSADFTLNKPASHPVAYGLFIGGTNLDQDDQQYTYLVIRQDGKFLVRQRDGAATSNVAGDWADHAAVAKPDASGKSSNELSIRVAKDAVTFLVNGQAVAKHPASAVDTVGIAGLRVGHGLDLQIDGFDVTEN